MTDTAYPRPVKDGELENLVGELRRRVDHAVSAAAATPADGGTEPTAALVEAVTVEVRRTLDTWALQYMALASRRTNELHATLRALQQDIARIGAAVERGQAGQDAADHPPAGTEHSAVPAEPELCMSGPKIAREHRPRASRPWLMLASVTTGLALAGGAVGWLGNPDVHALDLLEMLVRSIT